MSKLLVLIGGNPEGYRSAFHEETHSGKVLRSILGRNHIEAILYDLWSDSDEEREGYLSVENLQKINSYIFAGQPVIALGRYQYNKLHSYFAAVQYLPHPGSRHRTDLQKLERGLRKMAKVV